MRKLLILSAALITLVGCGRDVTGPGLMGGYHLVAVNGSLPAVITQKVLLEMNLDLKEIEKKLVAAVKRSSEAGMQQLARARTALFPDGRPQERVYGAASFTARYGAEVLDTLAAAAHAHADRLLVDAPREA